MKYKLQCLFTMIPTTQKDNTENENETPGHLHQLLIGWVSLSPIFFFKTQLPFFPLTSSILFIFPSLSTFFAAANSAYKTSAVQVSDGLSSDSSRLSAAGPPNGLQVLVNSSTWPFALPHSLAFLPFFLTQTLSLTGIYLIQHLLSFQLLQIKCILCFFFFFNFML